MGNPIPLVPHEKKRGGFIAAVGSRAGVVGMDVLTRLRNKETSLAVVGLGYVGFPIAVAFAKKVKTIGFDLNGEKIALYRRGIDPTHEVGDFSEAREQLLLTAKPEELQNARFIVVAVPTPIHGDKTPDLLPVIQASKLIGKNLSPGSVVVFESTVYPGVTEEVCVPVLEEMSGMKCGRDFKVGYSPERINPGDKIHRLENICKIVAGMDEETLDEVAGVYSLIIEAEVHRAPTIKVAEAAKLVENAQRDINIAFMNEIAMAFDRMGICTRDVMAAMKTKWNALGFQPGLVGGHCIGVDPYYFIYRAESLGYNSALIAAGRRVNDGMPRFVAGQVIKGLIRADHRVKRAKVYVMGVTFKEDCPDMRNSKALEVCRCLMEYGVRVTAVDPFAAHGDQEALFMGTADLADVSQADCLVFLVAHRQFRELCPQDLREKMNFSDPEKKPVVIDVKGIFSPPVIKELGCRYWSL